MFRLTYFYLLLVFMYVPSASYAADKVDDSKEEQAVGVEKKVKPERKSFKQDKKQKESEKSEDSAVQEESNTVILRGLNKVIGRASTLEATLGTILRFENLEIIARKCVKSAPDERPENAALLEIREIKIGEEPKQIFLGWMLSSSPALSSLEHPVYDITVLSCEFRKDVEQ